MSKTHIWHRGKISYKILVEQGSRWLTNAMLKRFEDWAKSKPEAAYMTKHSPRYKRQAIYRAPVLGSFLPNIAGRARSLKAGQMFQWTSTSGSWQRPHPHPTNLSITLQVVIAPVYWQLWCQSGKAKCLERVDPPKPHRITVHNKSTVVRNNPYCLQYARQQDSRQRQSRLPQLFSTKYQLLHPPKHSRRWLLIESLRMEGKHTQPIRLECW